MPQTKLAQYLNNPTKLTAFCALVEFYQISARVTEQGEKDLATKKQKNPNACIGADETLRYRNRFTQEKYGDLIIEFEPIRKVESIQNIIDQITKIENTINRIYKDKEKATSEGKDNSFARLLDIKSAFTLLTGLQGVINSEYKSIEFKVSFTPDFIEKFLKLKDNAAIITNKATVENIENLEACSNQSDQNTYIFNILSALKNTPELQSNFQALLEDYLQEIPNLENLRTEIEKVKPTTSTTELEQKKENLNKLYATISYCNNPYEHKPTIEELALISLPYTISETALCELTNNDGGKINPENHFGFTESDFLLAKSLAACNQAFTHSIASLSMEINNFNNWSKTHNNTDIKENGATLVKNLNTKVDNLVKNLAENTDNQTKKTAVNNFKKEMIDELYNSNEAKAIEEADPDYYKYKANNIYIALTGVGLFALGIKAAYSYATTGHVSLFFETESMQHKNKIAIAAKNVEI